MKTNIFSVLMLSALLAVTGCTSDDGTIEVYGRDDTYKSETRLGGGRTVLVYMAGRNDLESDLKNDLAEMKVGSKRISDNDNLIVFVRRYQDKDDMPWVARIRKGEVTDSVSVADLGINVSQSRACDPELMEQVMKYAFSHYPAAKDYGLVLWGHSSGWIVEDDIARRSGTRGFGVDMGDDGLPKWINIPELSRILEQMPHLAFIMGDCCHLMCLESLYELRHAADYIIGSTVEIPGDGAPYDQIVPNLFGDGDFWKPIVDKFYAAQGRRLPLSVVKTSEMDHVASATREVLPKVKAFIGDGYADMKGSVHYYNLNKHEFKPEYNIFYDGGEFVMCHAQRADYEQWKQALDKAVVYKVMTETKHWKTNKIWSEFYSDFTITEEKYHGVSMFVPQDPKTGCYRALNEDIKQLAWYDAVGLNVLDNN